MSRKSRRNRVASARKDKPPIQTPQPSGLRLAPTVSGGGACASGAEPVFLTLAEVRSRYAPPHVLGVPEDVQIACDNQLAECGVYSLLQHSFALGQMPQANFLGFGVLQQIAQNGLIRACIETVADDMTRNFIKLKREGEAQKSARREYLEAMGLEDEQARDDEEKALAEIKAEMERLGLQQVLHEAAATVGYMGGALVFVDTGEQSPEVLKTPLHIGRAGAELQPGRPLRFVVIDPISVFPGTYNSINPLKGDYFKPTTWWVMGQEVHASRLLRLVANELPVLLKPAYNFLGLAQAQILWDYVLHFQDCRIASQRLLSKFSLTVMKTSMAEVLTQAAGTAELDKRVALLVQHRSNDGVQVIDKETEDIVKLETPISGVTDIVRQALEILSAMNRTPAVKLLGISPSGFNATGESDIRNYYDHILSQQEKVLRPALTTILKILQIRLFGRIDETITFDFAPLSEADQAAEANTQKLRADTMAALLDRQVVSPEECRRALANDPDSIFSDIDAEELPEPPEDDMGGIEGMEGAGETEGEPRLDDVDKAGAVYDSEEWFTSKGGKHFQLETETGEITKGNVGQKDFSYQSKPLESATPDIAHYEALLKKHGGNAKKAAHEYFKERLQGRHVNAATDEGIIEACFTGGTWQEIKRGMHNDPLKAELVPHMADILVSGQHRRNALYKKRNDNAVDFYEYQKTVKTSQGPCIVIVDVVEREKSEPKYSVYSMNHDDRYGYESRGETGVNKASIASMSSGHSLITRNNTGFGDATIAPFFEVVNLRFAGEENC